MAKITVGSGPTDINAEPGTLVTDGAGWTTYLHPDEQEKNECLGNSSPSSPQKPSSSGEKTSDDPAPAPTTENPSEPDPTESGSARSTTGAGKASRTARSKGQ